MLSSIGKQLRMLDLDWGYDILWPPYVVILGVQWQRGVLDCAWCLAVGCGLPTRLWLLKSHNTPPCVAARGLGRAPLGVHLTRGVWSMVTGDSLVPDAWSSASAFKVFCLGRVGEGELCIRLLSRSCSPKAWARTALVRARREEWISQSMDLDQWLRP